MTVSTQDISKNVAMQRHFRRQSSVIREMSTFLDMTMSAQVGVESVIGQGQLSRNTLSPRSGPPPTPCHGLLLLLPPGELHSAGEAEGQRDHGHEGRFGLAGSKISSAGNFDVRHNTPVTSVCTVSLCRLLRMILF